MTTTVTYYFANGGKIEFGEEGTEPVVSGDPEGEYVVCYDDTTIFTEETYKTIMARLKERKK